MKLIVYAEFSIFLEHKTLFECRVLLVSVYSQLSTRGWGDGRCDFDPDGPGGIPVCGAPAPVPVTPGEGSDRDGCPAGTRAPRVH